MAFPRPALAASEQLVDLVLDLVSSEGVVEVVVGLPMQLNGVEGAAARSARALAEALAEALEAEGVVVTLQDERLSTVAAQRALHEAGQRAREQRAVLDSAAATILLEGFLACR
jgi:putative Holliday junction resolvase